MDMEGVLSDRFVNRPATETGGAMAAQFKG